MKKTFTLITAVLALTLASCSGSPSGSGGGEGLVEITGVADLTPHSELIEFARERLESQGVKVTLVSTAPDATSNQRTQDGEVDFNFFQHLPYLTEWNENNAGRLVSAGAIHVEPMSAYSDRYASVGDVPDGAVIAVPNNATNEYRALKLLEEAGFITLSPSAGLNLRASKADISAYLRPVSIVELDAAIIIPSKADYDIFITNVNRALEAKITSVALLTEGADSPYANIIVVRADLDADKRAAVDLLVEALRSDEAKEFILNRYSGKVVPAAAE